MLEREREFASGHGLGPCHDGDAAAVDGGDDDAVVVDCLKM